MRTWAWARHYDKWGLYVARSGQAGMAVIVTGEVPPDYAQFIVDACNAHERNVEESMRLFREATPNYHALKEQDSPEEARLRSLAAQA